MRRASTPRTDRDRRGARDRAPIRPRIERMAPKKRLGQDPRSSCAVATARGATPRRHPRRSAVGGSAQRGRGCRAARDRWRRRVGNGRNRTATKKGKASPPGIRSRACRVVRAACHRRRWCAARAEGAARGAGRRAGGRRGCGPWLPRLVRAPSFAAENFAIHRGNEGEARRFRVVGDQGEGRRH